MHLDATLNPLWTPILFFALYSKKSSDDPKLKLSPTFVIVLLSVERGLWR